MNRTASNDAAPHMPTLSGVGVVLGATPQPRDAMDETEQIRLHPDGQRGCRVSTTPSKAVPATKMLGQPREAVTRPARPASSPPPHSRPDGPRRHPASTEGLLNERVTVLFRYQAHAGQGGTTPAEPRRAVTNTGSVHSYAQSAVGTYPRTTCNGERANPRPVRAQPRSKVTASTGGPRQCRPTTPHPRTR